MSAEGRPLLAEWRGGARYATATASSATSENYGQGKVTRGVATFYGAAPAEERPFLARKREEAHHAALGPSSGISPNNDAMARGLEPGRPRKPTSFGKAAPAKKRPFLAREREEARHAALAPSGAISAAHSARRIAHGARNCAASRMRSEPVTFGKVAPATVRPLLAKEREDARHATATPSQQTVRYMDPMEGGQRRLQSGLFLQSGEERSAMRK